MMSALSGRWAVRWLRAAAVVGASLAGAAASGATIHLEWRVSNPAVEAGEVVRLGLFGVAGEAAGATVSAAQVLVAWDPAALRLLGSSPAGGVGFAVASFAPGDSWGFNEASPPADGDGLWFGFAPLTFPPTMLPVSAAGSLLATIDFEALAPAATEVALLASGQKPGRPAAHTEVYSGTQNVLGSIGAPAAITIVPEPAGVLGLLLVAAVRRR